MTSLLLADELSEKNDELEAYKVENNATVREKKDEILADKLDRLAQRISQIAENLADDEEIIEEVDSEIEEEIQEET